MRLFVLCISGISHSVIFLCENYHMIYLNSIFHKVIFNMEPFLDMIFYKFYFIFYKLILCEGYFFK